MCFFHLVLYYFTSFQWCFHFIFYTRESYVIQMSYEYIHSLNMPLFIVYWRQIVIVIISFPLLHTFFLFHLFDKRCSPHLCITFRRPVINLLCLFLHAFLLDEILISYYICFIQNSPFTLAVRLFDFIHACPHNLFLLFPAYSVSLPS